MNMKKLITFFSICVISFGSLTAVSESHTFVLIHGSWHGNWTFYKLKYELEKAGHKAICINLPGHGLDSANVGNVTLQDYQQAIVDVLDTLTEKVILVGHSMGGIAISAAAEARPEKIEKLVYLAAFMPKNGQTMLELALQDTLSAIGPSLIFDFPGNKVDIRRSNISKIFYDESTAEYVNLSKMLLTSDPLQPLLTPLTLTPENYGSVRRFYITTKYDSAITPGFQEKMYTEQPCEKVYTINTAHSPFFSAPQNLKNILIKIAEEKALQSDVTASEMSYKASDIKIKNEVNFFYRGSGNFTVNDNTINSCLIMRLDKITSCNDFIVWIFRI